MTRPADELHAAAQTLLDLADETAEDIASNDYWHSERVGPERWFANGIDNAVGGPGGRLAGLLSPATARSLAGWLRFEADLIARVPGAEMRERTHHALNFANSLEDPHAQR